MAVEIGRYRTASGDEPFSQWLLDLRDPQARILVRLERLALGNFGDVKVVRDGVSELRIDWGPGYRVYFGRDGKSSIVLLCGGDKRKQDADVEKAVALWREYANRERRREPRSKA